MRRPVLIALSVAAVSVVGLVPLQTALASQPSAAVTNEIVLDLPPDFVRYGSEMVLSGTVFDGTGRRAARNPVAVAVLAPGSEEDLVWGKTVTTDANGRFRTSVRADAATGDAVVLAPLLNNDEPEPQLARERVVPTRIQYPVTLKLAARPAGGLTVSGLTPECEDASLQVEAGLRGAFTPVGEPLACADGAVSGVVDKPGANYQYRLVRAADTRTARSVSPTLTVR